MKKILKTHSLKLKNLTLDAPHGGIITFGKFPLLSVRESSIMLGVQDQCIAETDHEYAGIQLFTGYHKYFSVEKHKAIENIIEKEVSDDE